MKTFREELENVHLGPKMPVYYIFGTRIFLKKWSM